MAEPVYAQPAPQPVPQPTYQVSAGANGGAWTANMEPAMQLYNQQARSFWVSWVQRGTIYGLIFVALYFGIQSIQTWDPFGWSGGASVEVGGSNGGGVEVWYGQSNDSGDRGIDRDYTRGSGGSSSDRGDYAMRIDHDRRVVFRGRFSLGADGRAELSRLRGLSYTVIPWLGDRDDSETSIGLLPHPDQSRLEALLTRIKDRVDAVDRRFGPDGAYYGRLSSSERETLRQELQDAKSAADEALGAVRGAN